MNLPRSSELTNQKLGSILLTDQNAIYIGSFLCNRKIKIFFKLDSPLHASYDRPPVKITPVVKLLEGQAKIKTSRRSVTLPTGKHAAQSLGNLDSNVLIDDITQPVVQGDWVITALEDETGKIKACNWYRLPGRYIAPMSNDLIQLRKLGPITLYLPPSYYSHVKEAADWFNSLYPESALSGASGTVPNKGYGVVGQMAFITGLT